MFNIAFVVVNKPGKNNIPNNKKKWLNKIKHHYDGI